MKLVTSTLDFMVDFNTMSTIKDEVQEAILPELADKGIQGDFSDTDAVDINSVLGSTSLEEFVGDKEIEI